MHHAIHFDYHIGLQHPHDPLNGVTALIYPESERREQGSEEGEGQERAERARGEEAGHDLQSEARGRCLPEAGDP